MERERDLLDSHLDQVSSVDIRHSIDGHLHAFSVLLFFRSSFVDTMDVHYGRTLLMDTIDSYSLKALKSRH